MQMHSLLHLPWKELHPEDLPREVLRPEDLPWEVLRPEDAQAAAAQHNRSVAAVWSGVVMHAPPPPGVGIHHADLLHEYGSDHRMSDWIINRRGVDGLMGSDSDHRIPPG